jgi:homoserine acetyltransferase
VMEKLGIEKAFVLGTSQGGWITVRMALLAPEKVGDNPAFLFKTIARFKSTQQKGTKTPTATTLTNRLSC